MGEHFTVTRRYELDFGPAQGEIAFVPTSTLNQRGSTNISSYVPLTTSPQQAHRYHHHVLLVLAFVTTDI